jgi:hypothetical protein
LNSLPVLYAFGTDSKIAVLHIRDVICVILNERRKMIYHQYEFPILTQSHITGRHYYDLILLSCQGPCHTYTVHTTNLRHIPAYYFVSHL